MLVPNRLTTRFEEVRARREAVLIGYLMVGDPDVPQTLEYARALETAGIDALELGIPFSDPIADGAVLQAAHQRALRNNINVHTLFQFVRDFRKISSLPIVLATYYNPVFKLGEEAFARRCSEAGVDGVIIADLPIEEAGPWVNQARKYGLSRVFSVTPETQNERVKAICEYASGFLYLASRYGPTGVQEELSPTALPLIERVRPLLPSDLKLAIGLGFSTRHHVESVVRAGTDGVVIASALAARVADGIPPEELINYVRDLKNSTRL
jgi:tryptophan synthase alpha chain